MSATHHAILLCLAAAATAQPLPYEPITSPDTDLHVSVATNGMPAWSGVPGAVLDEFPPYYANRFHLAVPAGYRVLAGSIIEFHCPAGGYLPTPCDIVMFVYECAPCTDTAPLAEVLVGLDGFKRSRCAPKFTVSAMSRLYSMTAYLRTIDPDTTFSVEMPQDADFAVFGISRSGARDCSALTDSRSCTADNVLGHCSWRVDQCVVAPCTQKGPAGPGAGCVKCAETDLLL